ncbi:hypothetical protein [Streptomyces johnsoniae]|uniref:Uncharacterized protein n=1 Tax=Streptomyces johnsoniae TaxID=3075532 RepID=A0ABU2RXC7_9ACTN|nr:hypothetical protein [Streptomyces sp. DSM 41886]MDT0441262.1 hypothetical protein [Streptomyces sp. DSM 41886]
MLPDAGGFLFQLDQPARRLVEELVVDGHVRRLQQVEGDIVADALVRGVAVERARLVQQAVARLVEGVVALLVLLSGRGLKPLEVRR